MSLLEIISSSPNGVTWGDLRRCDPQLDHYKAHIELEHLELNEKIIRDTSHPQITVFKVRPKTKKVKTVRDYKAVYGYNSQYHGFMQCKKCGEGFQKNSGNQKYCPECKRVK